MCGIEKKNGWVSPILVHHPPWHISRARRRLVHPRLFGLKHFADHIFPLLAQPLQPNCKLSLLLDQKQHNLLHLRTYDRHTTMKQQTKLLNLIRCPSSCFWQLKLRHSNSVVMEDHVNGKRAWKLAIQG
jgi:hypothetical protein